MRTPAGFECKFFYGNYFRGQKKEECRLIGNAPAPNHWTPDLCQKCPVPEILRANSCENMELSAQVRRSLRRWGLTPLWQLTGQRAIKGRRRP